MTRQLFGIEGLACAGCARGLEGRLKALPGVRAAGVHYLTASALIDWDEARVSVADLSGVTRKAGYRMAARHRPEEISAAMADESRRLSIRLAVAVFAGMWSMVPALVIYFSDLAPDLAWRLAVVSGVFALPVVLWSGAGILWMGWRSLMLRAPGMDLLISIGVISAFASSLWSLFQGRSEVWFDTATMLVTLLLFGRLVDTATRRSAIDALRAMEEAAPETALIWQDGATQQRLCKDVPVGSRIAVEAGDPVSMDGRVILGQSHVNRAVLTGETALVTIVPGDRVEAGSLNLGRRLVVEVDRPFGDREIDRMGGAIALEIARRGTRPGPADIWAARLSWGIPLIAVMTSVAVLALGLGIEVAFLRGLTLLVALCPCALSIALPLAQMRAASAGAGSGLRIRDPDAFATLAALRTIVFDKTGTLTSGDLRVTAVEPVIGVSARDLLHKAAFAETGINHPIARAIIIAHGGDAGSGGQRLPRGAEGRDAAGGLICIGTAERQETDGRTWLEVSGDGQSLGLIALEDGPAPGALQLMQELQAEGVGICIATGDAAAPALLLATELGLPESDVFHGCTPQDKADLVRRLPHPLAFVGDGVNDGPALAAADCGVSVAGAHSAAAHTASVVVTSGQISVISAAMRLSRDLGRIIRQNLALALGYNALMLPLAAFGLIGPELAAAAMLASSVSVVLNSQRIKSASLRMRI